MFTDLIRIMKVDSSRTFYWHCLTKRVVSKLIKLGMRIVTAVTSDDSMPFSYGCRHGIVFSFQRVTVSYKYDSCSNQNGGERGFVFIH